MTWLIHSFTPLLGNMCRIFLWALSMCVVLLVRVGINQEPFINLFKSHRMAWRIHENTMENGNTIATHHTHVCQLPFFFLHFSRVRFVLLRPRE